VTAVTFPLFPDQASANAGSVDAIYGLMVLLTVFFSVAIFVTIAFFAIRYHRKSDDEVPPEIHGSLALEITWSVIPLAIIAVIFILGAKIYIAASRPPADAATVYVVARQWMWKVQHPEGNSEINELHLPIGRPVKLLMTSEDVIHDFFVPAFRMKKDVLPGRYTQEWFTPTRLGRYHLFCSQYCGTNHSQMIGWVEVMEPSDFERWLKGSARTESMAAMGARLFGKLHCGSCHGAGGSAPRLAGLFGRPDEAHLRDAILHPARAGTTGAMPTYQGQMSETELLQLIAYVRTLSPEGPR
jgi:cytochrome c oxidase subunit 2